MSNAEQFEYWNGDAGQRWAQEDGTMARLLRPISSALLDHTEVEGSNSALDVGCGGGSQSLMLAERLGPSASVLGVDLSAPMLEVARLKSAGAGGDHARVSFIQADAATHDFEPQSFDLLFPRFGVMFFDDPVSAFTHMRSALRPQARLAFCCWQSLQHNDWTLLPLQAALQHVPAPETPDPHAPGPFAFADSGRVSRILQDSGYTDVSVQSFSTDMRFSKAPSVAQSVRELAMIGPVSRLLADQEQPVLERVFTAMEETLTPHYRDGALSLPGALWFVTARSV